VIGKKKKNRKRKRNEHKELISAGVYIKIPPSNDFKIPVWGFSGKGRELWYNVEKFFGVNNLNWLYKFKDEF